MTIFVTGSTGFVGLSLVRKLLEKGHNVRCLVRNLDKAKKTLPAEAEALQGDITQPQDLAGFLVGCEAVVHLVGIIAERKEATFEKIHVQGTANVIEAAKQARVDRYLHMSALGSRPDAASRYHQTKYQAEQYVQQSGLKHTIFRPSVIFGPTDRFVNLLASLIRISPVVFIMGDGRARIQPVALEDVVYCFVEALEKEETVGKIYHLGGPCALSFNEILDILLQVMNKRRIKVHLPIGLVQIPVRLIEKILPILPITRDQLIMLQEDNVCEIGPVMSDFDFQLLEFKEGIKNYVR